MKSSLIIGAFLFFNFVFAGEIRTIEVDKSTMGNVYLRLGQSTVLRFREKPKKVVVGNQNYFNIEFIENDLTIQPQENVTSNLFVYGEFHTYGIILHTGNRYNYDDLVNINWRHGQTPIVLKEPTPETKQKVEEKFFDIKLKKSFFDEQRGVSVADIVIINCHKEFIKTETFAVKLLQNGKELPLTTVFESEKIEKGQEVKVRVVYGKVDSEVTAIIDFKGKSQQIVIGPPEK